MVFFNNFVKMFINEFVLGKKKFQIEEYVIFNFGFGVQYIVFLIKDIIIFVVVLCVCGVEFINVFSMYYDIMCLRMKIEKRKWEF